MEMTVRGLFAFINKSHAWTLLIIDVLAANSVAKMGSRDKIKETSVAGTWKRKQELKEASLKLNVKNSD